MNTELLTADLTAVNYLCHYGVAGMEWYKNKADRWQPQAKYARGQSNPNARSSGASDKAKTVSSASSKSKPSGSKVTQSKEYQEADKFLKSIKENAVMPEEQVGNGIVTISKICDIDKDVKNAGADYRRAHKEADDTFKEATKRYRQKVGMTDKEYNSLDKEGIMAFFDKMEDYIENDSDRKFKQYRDAEQKKAKAMDTYAELSEKQRGEFIDSIIKKYGNSDFFYTDESGQVKIRMSTYAMASYAFDNALAESALPIFR